MSALSSGSAAGAWVDIDNDGDLDLAVSTMGLHRHYLFVNNGSGSFTEEAIERGARVTMDGDPSLTSGGSIGVGDYDGDGWLDLYFCEWRMYYTRNYTAPGHLSNSRLLRNLGSDGQPGHFEDVTVAAGVDMAPVARRFLEKYHLTAPLPKGVSPSEQRSIPNGVYTFAPIFADFDDDGAVDLFISGDFDTSAMFWNNGDGTFSEGSREAGLGIEQNGMGATAADIDGDGRLDLYVTAIFSDRPQDELTGFGVKGSFLYRNEGGRRFSDVTEQFQVGKGNWGWGAAFFDFDHDKDLDLMTLSGYVMTESTFDDEWNVTPSHLFANESGSWVDHADEAGVSDLANGRGLLLLDYDNDGDLDVFTVNYAGQPRLFRNDGAGAAGHSWLRVNALDHVGGRESLGARVTVHVDGEALVSYIGSVTAFQGQSEAAAHLGLGSTTGSVSVEVEWPSPAPRKLTISDVRVNTSLVVVRPTEGDGDVSITMPEKLCPWSAGVKPLVDVPVNTVLEMSSAIEEHGESIPRPATPRVEAPRRMTHLLSEITMREATKIGKRPTSPADGVGNNKRFPQLGATGTRLIRRSPAAYGDGVSTPRGDGKLPSTRVISNAVSAQVGDVRCELGLSDLAVHFGQLITHDFDHTTPQASAAGDSFFPIPVPNGDPVFDTEGTGKETIRFRRSIYDPDTGTSADNPRQQVNKVTSYLDGSLIYGSDAKRLEELRSHDSGMLATEVDDVSMPGNKRGLPNDNPLGRPTRDLRLAGDARSNIQPGLLALHTLFLREHNEIAAILNGLHAMTAFGGPDGQPRAAGAGDDDVFNSARLLVTSELQAITFNEFIPLLVGPDALPPYTGYKPDVDPSMSNEFATVAFRFGHSQANEHLNFVLANGTHREPLQLTKFYFRTREVLTMEEGGIDPLVRGMLTHKAQATDLLAIDGVRNFMFGTREQGGIDLIATNIQRGRDHGIADYNTVREAYGLPRKDDFSSICADPATGTTLASLYDSVDDLDLLVGGLCEPHVEGGVVGETFRAIMVDQFVRMRDGDRFWYANVFDEATAELFDKMRFGDLIRRHVAIKDRKLRRLLDGNVFLASNDSDSDASTAGKLPASFTEL